MVGSLRDNFSFNKTFLKMKDEPTTLQSQPLYDTDNAVDYSEKLKQELKKDLSQQTQSKIVDRHRKRYTATRIKHSPTRIKSRNFLSNISYTDINKKDFYIENLILDVYVLLLKNLNPFSLNRKVIDKKKRDMVNMLWRECIPLKFYNYIHEDKNFIHLNDKDVNYPQILKIVGEFMDHRKQNLRMLQEYLAQYKDVYQCVYSHVFPEIYTSSEKRGFDIKSNFHILFKSYQDKQLVQRHSTAENLSHYDKIETSEYDQNPIRIFEGFSDEEENDTKKSRETNC